MPSSAPFAARLAEAQAGDGQAFAALVDPLAGRLLLYLRRRAGGLAGPDCGAEDLLQQVLLRAWQALEGFSPQGPDGFYRWLVSIARGIVSDRLKYQQAKGRGGVQLLGSRGDRAAYDPRTSVSQVIARREAFERVEALLDELEPTARRVVEGHLLEGRSLAELASELGLGKTTVWDRLQRALGTLREALAESRVGL